MSGETKVTFVGNVTADPELRRTSQGLSVANWTIAVTPRAFNRETNQMEDKEALFLRCSCWRDFADNVNATLKKGMRVIVTGDLKQRGYETAEGEKRTSIELDVEAIGPDLRWAIASVERHQTSGTQAANRAARPPQGAAPQSEAGWYNPDAGQGGYNPSAGYAPMDPDEVPF